MNIVPGALWRPIDVGNRARRVKGRGLIGHVAVSGSTLLLPGPLSTRASDWTFYLPKEPYPTGERFAQLIDLDLQCWSSGAGNLTCPAFESQGGLGTTVQVNAEPWTPNQVESAAIILAHLNRTEGTPLQDMGNSLASSRGFGVHRYGIDPWRVSGGEVWSSARGKSCPGDAKVRQIPQIIARAIQIVNGDDDMQASERITDPIYPNTSIRVSEALFASVFTDRKVDALVATVTALSGQVAGLLEAVKQLAAAPGQAVDLGAVAAAAKSGAEAALSAGVDVNVNVGGAK